MKRVLVGLAVFVAGCGGTVVKECESTCGQGQRCDTATGLCVKDEAPTLTLETVPTPLTTAKVTVRGTTKDDVGVSRGEASFAGQAPVAFTVTDDAFSVELDVPALDSAEAALSVKVFDTGDQPAEATATTVVDLVGPTVAITEPDRLLGGATVTIAGTSQDGSGSVEQVQVDFGPGAVTATVASGGGWTVQLAPPAERDGQATPLAVTAKDKFGNQSTSTLSVKLDTTGPTFTLTAPTDTVGGTLATVSGTVADTGGPVSMVTVRFGGIAQDVAATDGGFSATVMLPQDLDGETRAVTFTAADQFGNPGTSNFDLIIDTRGPALTLAGPMVIGTTGELTGRAVDSAQPVTDVTVDVQGSAGPVPVDSFMNGDWRLAVTFPAGLDAVTRTVALSAKDARGNTGTGMGSVTVDTVPPVGAISTPAANARLTGATATFTGTVTDGTSVQAVELDFADGQGFRAATVTGSTWTVDVPLSATENDVGHLVTARFTDGVGNVSTVTRTVTVDNAGPTVSVTTPAAGTVVGGTATTVAVSVSATDPAGVSGVSVALGTASPVAAARQGTSNTWTATLPLPTGQDFVTLALRAIATDTAGNQASAMGSVVVDNVAPVLTITAPTAGQVFNISNFTASGNVTLTWTLTDGDPTARVTEVGGVAVSGGASAPWPTLATDDFRTYNLGVRAADRMNNSTTRSATFIVDRVAPTVTFSPANSSRNVDPRQVTLTFSEELSASPADPLVLSPASAAPAGAWQGGTRVQFTRAGLEPYVVFTASLNPGLTDRAGNPVVPGTSRFHTSARVPPNGTVIANGVWAFDVASDLDGVPMIVTIGEVAANNYTIDSHTMDGATATFSSWGFSRTQQHSILGFQAFAWSSVNADLTSTPIRGLWHYGSAICTPSCSPTLSTNRAWTIGSIPMFIQQGGTLVPSGSLGPADGTGVVGFITGTTYYRDPFAHTLGVNAAVVAPGGARWNAASTASGGSVQVSSHRCTTTFGGNSYCFPVTDTVVTDASSTASWLRIPSGPQTMSMATADNGCTLLAYPSTPGGARRVASISDPHSRAPCSGVCLYPLTTSTATAPTLDFIVGRGAGGAILGVGSVVGGKQLFQTSNCGGSWSTIGAPLSVALEARPAMIGTQPGFFYVDATRTLRAHVP